MKVKTLKSQIAVEPTLEGLEEVREVFLEFLGAVELKEAVQQDWKLTFTEVVANGVNHSSARTQGKRILVSWGQDQSQKQIWLEVQDPGPGPKKGLLENPQLPESPMETSGRGLYIINKFADGWSHIRCQQYYRQRIFRWVTR